MEIKIFAKSVYDSTPFNFSAKILGILELPIAFAKTTWSLNKILFP